KFSILRFLFVVLVFEAVGSAQTPTLTVDLRATGTSSGVVLDSKHVLFTGGIGGTVQMDIWAVVGGGTNGMNDEWVSWLHGSFLSSYGGLLGDLSASVVHGWDNVGAGNGTQQDLDGDTDRDVGSNDDSSPAFFFRAQRGQDTPLLPEAKVGNLIWTRV